MRRDYDWYFEWNVEFTHWFIGVAFDHQTVFFFLGPIEFSVQWV